MNSGVLDKVRQSISDVFGVPLHEVSAESSPQTVEAWDSMGHLNLVLALEQSFAVQFSPEEITQMTSAGGIATLLARKGVSASS